MNSANTPRSGDTGTSKAVNGAGLSKSGPAEGSKRKKNKNAWPKALKQKKAGATPKDKSAAPVFTGRINSISVKEPTPGVRQVSFSIRGKDGEDRTYQLNRGEWTDAAELLVAAYAGKRKVRVTTAEGANASRVVEIEARK